jgi:hypothetical protein
MTTVISSKTQQQQITAILEDVSRNPNPSDDTAVDRIRRINDLIHAGKVPTLEPLLPLMFTLNGQSYTLKEHFPMSPLFKTMMAKRTLFRTGRQVSKSTSISSHGILLSNVVPYFRTFFITPLYEQIRRFSNNYVRPFIATSPIRSLLVDTRCEQSVLQRSFRNGSVMLFSFALLDASRTRGVSSDYNRYDEVQDMDPDHLPIIDAAMSHSKYELRSYTGTPKTLDNPIEGLWHRSSRAEWVIPCFACGFDNIPSIEYHLDGMVGPLRDDICEERPGVVCHKCRRPINPRAGHWWHRHPERRHEFAGYHLPQIILPLHYARYDKWAEILRTQANEPPHIFYNEIMGEAVDSGQKLITETELRAAATLPWSNNPDDPSPDMLRRLAGYPLRVLAIDWGGGGADGVSFTALALLCITPSNKIEVVWGKRLVTSQDHMKEAKECLYWLKKFNCQLVAHDYTGAGVVRETVMVQAGFDISRIMAIEYVRAAASNLIKFVPATPLHNRDHYRLDKTRSLLYVMQAIKTGLLSFYKQDIDDRSHSGLMRDFLALIEEKTTSRVAGDIYVITRNPMLTDDFAQAVNIGAAALWHARNAWPNFAAAANVAKISTALEQAAGSREYGWENDNRFMDRP